MMLQPSVSITGESTLAITTHNAWYVNEGDITGLDYLIQVFIDNDREFNFDFVQADY